MSEKHYALCVSHGGYPAALETRKVYEIRADRESEQRGMLRVLDESGSDYLYPKELFVRISLPEAAQRAFNQVA